MCARTRVRVTSLTTDFRNWEVEGKQSTYGLIKSGESVRVTAPLCATTGALLTHLIFRVWPKNSSLQ